MKSKIHRGSRQSKLGKKKKSTSISLALAYLSTFCEMCQKFSFVVQCKTECKQNEQNEILSILLTVTLISPAFFLFCSGFSKIVKQSVAALHREESFQ